MSKTTKSIKKYQSTRSAFYFRKLLNNNIIAKINKLAGTFLYDYNFKK